MIFPDLSGADWPRYPYLHLHQKVSAAAESMGFSVLDLYPEYAKHPRELLVIDEEDFHPSPFAHELAAEGIYFLLRKEFPGWLKTREQKQ